ncbi:MAG TPA: hypothetical protein PLK76_02165 [bacterium]|nr:hypothetical protein [bacterium]
MTKVTTPLSILVFIYLLMIGLSLIILILAIFTACDFYKLDQYGDEYRAAKFCKEYLKSEEYGLYNECYYQKLAYFKQLSEAQKK